MGFRIRRISKEGNEAMLENINSDYHNGECLFVEPFSELEKITSGIMYLVVDYSDHVVLIYPGDSSVP